MILWASGFLGAQLCEHCFSISDFAELEVLEDAKLVFFLKHMLGLTVKSLSEAQTRPGLTFISGFLKPRAQLRPEAQGGPDLCFCS